MRRWIPRLVARRPGLVAAALALLPLLLAACNGTQGGGLPGY
jgi:predicted small secreted protein